MTQHCIIMGDSRNLAEMDDESVHLVVMSPTGIVTYAFDGKGARFP